MAKSISYKVKKTGPEVRLIMGGMFKNFKGGDVFPVTDGDFAKDDRQIQNLLEAGLIDETEEKATAEVKKEEAATEKTDEEKQAIADAAAAEEEKAKTARNEKLLKTIKNMSAKDLAERAQADNIVLDGLKRDDQVQAVFEAEKE